MLEYKIKVPINGNETESNITGLLPGVTYKLTIKSQADDYLSEDSVPITIQTLYAVPTYKPNNITITHITPNSVSLEWKVIIININ